MAPHMDSNASALRLYEKLPRGVVIARRACYNCNHAENLILFPTLIETEGQLALCNRCIKRAAKLLGLVSAEALKEELKKSFETNVELEKTIADQGVVIESYEQVFQAKKRLDPTLPDDEPIPGLAPISP